MNELNNTIGIFVDLPSFAVAIGTTTLASYEYNDVTGTLKKLTYGNGTSVNYTYNELDMLTRVT